MPKRRCKGELSAKLKGFSLFINQLCWSDPDTQIPMILLALVSFLAVIQIQTGSSAISLKSAIQKTLMVHALGCAWLLLWPWL